VLAVGLRDPRRAAPDAERGERRRDANSASARAVLMVRSLAGDRIMGLLD
jgi:hypothetical protein